MVLGLVFCFSYSSRAELNPDFIDPNNSNTTQHNIGDDSAASVPLTFGFPFYGTTYYYSWMHSNGVISLVGVNQNPPADFCCSGIDLSTGTTTITNFIAPLWVDLIQADQDGGFYTMPVDSDGDGEPDSMRYLWDRIEEYYNANENTFGVELFKSGKVDMHHETINITEHNISIAIKGNNNDQQIGIDFSSGSGLNTTTYANTYSGIPANDITAQCAANPLYSPECSGYADAYAAWLYQEACNADALYDSGCPGYEQKYYETYVLPGLNEQIEEASGTDTNVATRNTTQTGGVEITATGVRDPVQSATNVSQTGDATVDEILRENNDVSTNTVVVNTAPTEMPTTTTRQGTTQTEEREGREERVEETIVTSVEREVENERENQPSSNVDEPNNEEISNDGGEERSEISKSNENKGEEKKESRKEKIKNMVAEKAKNLANDMSKAASIEDQQKIQAQVLALIGFNPDFGTYAQNIIPQNAFYQVKQMPDTNIPKFSRGLRNGLAQQLLHEKMVDMQYNR